MGAAAPTRATVFGRPANNGALFNDTVSLSSLARVATITCTPQGIGDAHCDNSTGVLQYAQGTYINNFQLTTTSADQMGINASFNLYKLVP